MIFAEEQYTLDGKKIALRSARFDEAQMLLDYMKVVTGETRFLMSESDEIRFTRKDEEQFINDHNQSEHQLLLLAEVKKLGFEQAELSVAGNNEKARHLYESLGFKVYGTLPNANKYDDGTYDDDIFMMLKL